MAHIEIDKVIIPDWECREIKVCTELRDKFIIRTICSISCWHMEGNIWRSGEAFADLH